MQPDLHDADDGGAPDAPLVQPDAGAEIDAALADLRARGAHQFDASRFRYLEALQRRMLTRHGALRLVLAQRLAQAVRDYAGQYAAAISELESALPDLVQSHPQAARELRRMHADGDVLAARRRVARLADWPGEGPLAQLVRLLDDVPATRGAPASDGPLAESRPDTGALAELRTVQRFRDTWSRLRLDEQLARSQLQAPDNPGPLNSHLLVLRSLRCMQEIAPAYLERFVAHVEALAWLETAQVAPPAAPGKPVAARERRAGKPGVRRNR